MPDTNYRGDISFSILTQDNAYVLDVCLADVALTNDNFMTEYAGMLSASSAKPDVVKYYAFAEDIRVANLRPGFEVNKYYFFHTLDGRGRMLTAQTDSGYVYAASLLGQMQTGSVLKNLIVKQITLRDSTASNNDSHGTIAKVVNNGAIIENNVIINTVYNSTTGNKEVGLLAGTIWGADTVIRNNIVIDDYTSAPPTTGAITTAGWYDATGAFVNETYEIHGLFGRMGGSSQNNAKIANNIVISTHGYILAKGVSGGVVSDLAAGALDSSNQTVANYAAFKTAVGANISNFLLLTDNGATGTIGSYTVE